MKKERLSIIPAPDRVLIQISREQIEALTSKEITREDGTKARLFLEPEFDQGFDRKFQQNVSCAVAVAVGEEISSIYPSDLLILDYLVTAGTDELIGFVNGNQMVSIKVTTTYHDTDAPPMNDGRRGWVKGDYDFLSQVLGVIRNDKIICFPPYIFLVNKTNRILKVLPNGKIVEDIEKISEREVLAAPKGSPYRDGDKILIKETEMFSRHLNGKEVSVCFQADILCKK